MRVFERFEERFHDDEVKRVCPGEYEHSIRVGNIALLTCLVMGTTREQAETYQMAGFVHDIGKTKHTYKPMDMGNMDVIAEYEDWLEDECRQDANHVDAAELVMDCSDYCTEYKDAIEYHHNAYNGTGFCAEVMRNNPDFKFMRNNSDINLRGKYIPNVAQVIYAANLFDEFISDASRGGKDPRGKVENRMIEYINNGMMNPYFAGFICDGVAKEWFTLSDEEKERPMSYEHAAELLGVKPKQYAENSKETEEMQETKESRITNKTQDAIESHVLENKHSDDIEALLDNIMTSVSSLSKQISELDKRMTRLDKRIEQEKAVLENLMD